MKTVLELAASGTSKGYIRWISVEERVPDDRRNVLTWGGATMLFVYQPWKEGLFLGVSKFNPTKDGGKWDCEQLHSLSIFVRKVTHWAEIVGPS